MGSHEWEIALTRSVPGAIAAGLLLMASCASFHGPLQIEIPEAAIPIVDSVTGESIREVLVIPRYQASRSGDSPVFWVGNPFIYKPGEQFPLRRPVSEGTMWSFGRFSGTAVTLAGTLVVAAGYRPCYTRSLWDRELDPEFALLPVSRQEAVASMSYLYDVLNRSEVAGYEAGFWGVGTQFKVAIEVSAEELAPCLEYLSEGLRQFDAPIPGQLPSNGVQPPADSGMWRSDGYGRCVSRG